MRSSFLLTFDTFISAESSVPSQANQLKICVTTRKNKICGETVETMMRCRIVNISEIVIIGIRNKIIEERMLFLVMQSIHKVRSSNKRLILKSYSN